MIIDESKLYGNDHYERSIEYIQQFFQEAGYPYVISVYAMGSVVTGDHIAGYSDLDIVIIAKDTDVTTLMKDLRLLSNSLRVPDFYLHKTMDFPPLDLHFKIRLLAESKLLYGKDSLNELDNISSQELCFQLRTALSHRAVALRALCSSRALQSYTPVYTLYYCQKLCFFGLRSLLMLQGDWNTTRKHVIDRVRDTEDLLSLHMRSWFLNLLERLEQSNYPRTLDEKLTIVFGTIDMLEEILRKAT